MSKEAWGRWGVGDERGAFNSADAAAVKRAVRLVRDGRVFDLAQPLSPRTPLPAQRNRVAHLMDQDGGDYAAGAERPGGYQVADDTLFMPVHVGTHIDALCHAWYDDQLYNGFPGDGTRSATAATRCGVDKLGPIVTRGVLFDFVRHRGAPLGAGATIAAADLVAIAASSGIAIDAGDAVLIRTGWLETMLGDPQAYFGAEPGIDESGALWLAERGVSLVGADNFAIEVIPFAAGKVFPVHQRLIRDFGIPLLEGSVLAALGATGAAEFLFATTPLPIVGGTGSPVCPLAVI
jgi:kynurenine formamidase